MPHQLPPVDDEVFAALQRLAVPLVDDVNSVLRRLLDLDSAGPAPAQAATSGGGQASGRRQETLPDSDYEGPLLQALLELGGEAAASTAVARIEKLLRPRLTAADYDELKSGGPRWRNRAQFARLRLVRSGHISSDSPRGIWSLTEYGTRVAKGESIDGGHDD